MYSTDGINEISKVTQADREIFARIKPICVGLSQITFRKEETSILQDARLKSLLKDLIKELSVLAGENKILPQNFGDYVFVPISAMLKTCSALSDSLTTLILQVIATTTKVSWSQAGQMSVSTLGQMLTLCNFLISPDLESSLLPNKDEEFQSAAVDVLKALFGTSAMKQWDRKMLPALGHSITNLLTVLENSQMSIQLKTCQSLRLLYDALHDGEMLSNVVPGSISTFVKVLSKPGLTTHFQVAITVLQTMTDLLCLVYNDQDLKTVVRDSGTELSLEVTNEGTHRKTNWLNATSLQINKALEPTLNKLVTRHNDKLDNALFETCLQLLQECHYSLSHCKNLLLKTALSLNTTDKSALQVYRDEIAKLLRNNKYDVSTEFYETSQVNIVKNSLQILGTDQIGEFQISRVLLNSIDESLKNHLVKIDGSHPNELIKNNTLELTEYSLKGRNTFSGSVIPRMSKTVHENVSSILTLLGHKMPLTQLESATADQLSINVDVLTQPCHNIWITSQLLSGSYYSNNAVANFLDLGSEPVGAQLDVLELGNEFLTTLLNQIEWNQLQITNILMSLYAIKQMIVIMGNDFKAEFLDYVYNLIECCASENEDVRHLADDIIHLVADEFYNGSMVELLDDNLDYVVDGISARLDNCLFQRAYKVLHLLIRFSGYELVERLNDILEKLFWMLEYYHGHSDLCIVLLNLFIEMSHTIKNTYMVENDGKRIEVQAWNRDSFKPWGMKNIDQVFDVLDKEKSTATENELEDEMVPHPTAEDFFKERLQQEDSDDEKDDTISLAESDAVMPNEVRGDSDEMRWESPIPRTAFMLLLRFWTYADRLLTHSSRTVRSKALDLMILLCPLLSTQQAIFLPNVAKSWDIVVHLSVSEDMVQVARCFELLSLLITHTNSFLLKRVMDMWSLFSKRDTLVSRLRKPVQESDSSTVRHNSTYQLANHPNVLIQNARKNLHQLSLAALSQFGLQLPDNVSVEISHCLLPDLLTEPLKTDIPNHVINLVSWILYVGSSKNRTQT